MTLLCSDTESIGIVDWTIAPGFLLYSYIPIALLCLLLALIIYLQNSKKSLNIYFALFSLTYALFLIFEIMHWVATPVVLVHFTWQMSILLHFLIIYFITSFYYASIFNKKLPYLIKSIFILLGLPIVLFLSTQLNISSFDISNCEGVNGVLWNYIYILQILTILFILGLSIYKNRISKTKRKDLIFSGATILFLLIFFVTNIWGDATTLYEVNILGPIGMIAFIAFLTFSIVRYKTFNIKLLGSQGLIFTLFFLNFAAIFIQKIQNMKLILGVNLLIVILIGHYLIRSVKKVDEQRELLEKANQNQKSLLHFITHQVKGYMTKSRNIFDAIIMGDYGDTNEKIKEIAQYGFDSETRGVETVQSILHASDLKSGRTVLVKEAVNVSSIVAGLVERRTAEASKKGIDLTFDIEPNIEVLADIVQIKEVFKNMIINALIYTLKGTVHIELKTLNNKVSFKVVDTGFGLTSEDKEKLFREGGKSSEALSVNVDSTGYGLFIAKKIVEEHNGTIGAHSEGRGKGSEFFVLLPKIQ